MGILIQRSNSFREHLLYVHTVLILWLWIRVVWDTTCMYNVSTIWRCAYPAQASGSSWLQLILSIRGNFHIPSLPLTVHFGQSSQMATLINNIIGWGQFNQTNIYTNTGECSHFYWILIKAQCFVIPNFLSSLDRVPDAPYNGCNCVSQCLIGTRKAVI